MSATDTGAGGTTEPSDEDLDLSKDELFHLLQNGRRRAVLRYLDGRKEAVRMRDVAEQVAAWEHDTTVQQLSSDQRQRVYIALYQTHLSTLDEAGIIEYNKPRGVVTPTPMVDRVVAYLDASDSSAAEHDTPARWPAYYVAVLGLTAGVFGGIASRAWPFSTFSPSAISAVTVGLFGLLTLATLFVAHT